MDPSIYNQNFYYYGNAHFPFQAAGQINHHHHNLPPNLFMNHHYQQQQQHPQQYRTFASVVSCNMSQPRWEQAKIRKNNVDNSNIIINNNQNQMSTSTSDIMNSFFNNFNTGTKSYVVNNNFIVSAAPNQIYFNNSNNNNNAYASRKDFEDYKYMPSLNNHHQQQPQPTQQQKPHQSSGHNHNVNNNNFYVKNQRNSNENRMPGYKNPYYQQQQPQQQNQHQHNQYQSNSNNNSNNNNNNSQCRGINNLIGSLFSNMYSMRPKNNYRWWNNNRNGRNCRSKNNYNSNNNNNSKQQYQYQRQNYHHTPSRFHHHDAMNPKNMHKKERNSIERDIQNDCDISKTSSNVNTNFEINSVVDSPPPTFASSSSSTTNKKACDDGVNCENPPFELYSLEEFPAIVTTVKATSSNLSTNDKKCKNNKSLNDVDVSDFVHFKDDVSKTTPSFTPQSPPKRISLCEKVSRIVKSPQTFFTIPIVSPKRSCLKPTAMRQVNRTISESSDDFIVFDHGSCDDENEYNNQTLTEDDDDDSEDDNDSIDSDTDDTMMEDESDHAENSSHHIQEIQSQQPDSGVEEKKVHFNLVPKIHTIRAWDYAYRQARKGDCWRRCAVDRERFNKRVSDLERTINPILSSNHRDKIFNERFN